MTFPELTTKNTFTLCALFIVIQLFLSQSVLAISYTKEISQEELQEKLSSMMPLEKKKLFFTLILTEPRIDLLENNNKIAVSFLLTVKAPGNLKGSGSTIITGSLSYNAKQGKFYLSKPKILELNINKMSDKMTSQVKVIAQSFLEKSLAKRPIYTLKDDNVKQKMAKSVLQSVSVKNNKLLVVLNVF